MEVVYVPGPGKLDRDQGLLITAQWLVQRSASDDGEPLVIVPVQDSVGHSPVLQQIASAFRTESSRTFKKRHWSGGPVLAVWPSQDVLDEVDNWRQATAVCVVQWTPDQAGEWLRGHSAQDISDSAESYSAPEIADPVVLVAMEDLTTLINMSTGLIHPSDRAMAVLIEHMLHRKGHRIDPAELYRWAIANSWRPEGATDLREIAERVLDGRRFRVGSRFRISADAYKRWVAEAKSRSLTA